VIIEDVSGMVEINGTIIVVANATGSNFRANDLDGAGVNTSLFNAYIFGGYLSSQNLLPSATSFYESRLVYGRADSPKR